MMKLRVDVDYPYPSRKQSFLYVALGIKSKKRSDYLRNSRILARMINESKREVMVYWFFTPYTIPNKSLLDLLKPDRHEVALHVAKNPMREWKILENETGRTVKSYSIHGTDRLFAQVIWHRKIGQRQADVPSNFPLKSYQSRPDFPTESLDSVRYYNDLEETKKIAEERISQNYVLSIHPEWLFKRGEENHRGPYYDALKELLDVDQDFDALRVRKRVIIKIAQDSQEYERTLLPTEEFAAKMTDRGVDVYTFIEHKWCCPITNPPSNWIAVEDNVGLLKIKDYESWFQAVGKKTRNMIRKAEKEGIQIAVVEANEQLAESIWKIYNETPIRQGRAFSHYGETLETVIRSLYTAKKNTFIAAYLGKEIVGFIQLLYGDNIAIVSNILSLQKHWDKALNNALIAKAVEICAQNGNHWLMYGRVGNHPSLDKFKESNGFVKYTITRFYVPLNCKGKIAIRLGLHLELKDALPDFIKYPLIPAMNWVSRTKVKLRHR